MYVFIVLMMFIIWWLIQRYPEEKYHHEGFDYRADPWFNENTGERNRGFSF